MTVESPGHPVTRCEPILFQTKPYPLPARRPEQVQHPWIIGCISVFWRFIAPVCLLCGLQSSCICRVIISRYYYCAVVSRLGPEGRSTRAQRAVWSMASSCLRHTLSSHNRQRLGGQRRSWLEDEIPLALCHTPVSTRTPVDAVDAFAHEVASLPVPGIRKAQSE